MDTADRIMTLLSCLSFFTFGLGVGCYVATAHIKEEIYNDALDHGVMIREYNYQTNEYSNRWVETHKLGYE